ncbi:TPA: Bro-N domain-containing protein [Klebsiella oxytoca]
MNALSVFSFQENHPVRVVLVNGEPWFVALDVTKALRLTNPTMALKALDDDERAKFNLGRQGETNVCRNRAG